MYNEVRNNIFFYLSILILDFLKYVFSDSYGTNALKLLQIKSKENLQLLRETVDRKGWGTSPPTIVNAFYSASRNQISKENTDDKSNLYFILFEGFPAGILQMPFFNKDAPKYVL
jgi:predicted metalloendopeptidase